MPHFYMYIPVFSGIGKNWTKMGLACIIINYWNQKNFALYCFPLEIILAQWFVALPHENITEVLVF